MGLYGPLGQGVATDMREVMDPGLHSLSHANRMNIRRVGTHYED